MPSPGATPVKDYDALDLGRTNDGRWLIGTRYSDGSYVIWDADTEEEVAYIEPGRQDPADLGGGRAAVINPDGSLTAFDIANPPPAFRGAPAETAAPGDDLATRRPVPIRDTPAQGRYPATMPGQTVPGRPTDVPFGSTVAPSTWNPAVPAQGRREGWGSIGAGTAGIQYGYGVPGFGQAPIPIHESNLPHLFDPVDAPGYIPGSGTYNQYRLDQPGLFGTVRGSGSPNVVNLRYGLGGTGDPTTGHELQTPQRYITGNAADSGQALQGDEYARGLRPLPGGGGWDQSWAAAAPRYLPGPGVSAPPMGMVAPGYGATPAPGAAVAQPGTQPGIDMRQRGAGGGGGGGMGGGFFTAGPGYSPAELGRDWDEAPQTAGLDYLVTLFMRSDTPTGISTAAWSAPREYWDGLADAIRRGVVRVTDPQAWAMLRERGYTPQSIGGQATAGGNIQPDGSGGTTEDAIANKNAADAADRAAYWAYQQALLRQGDERIALDEARQAWQQTYETASLTGQFSGQDTMAMAQQRFAQDLANRQFGLSEAGVTGTYQGQDTLAKIAQQNQTALSLLGLQAGMRGPRDWAAYQSTFGSTPQGLRDVMGAFQGRYQLPTGTGAGAGAQGGRASVSGLAGDILSGTYGQDGQSGGQQALANPRQADLQNWARMQPSQREMILGQYENQGWYGPDVENLIKGAAPRYAGPSGASYNFFQS